MVKEIEITSRRIILKNEQYNISDLYKRIKNKAEELGYLVVEKEQSTKFTKYGQEIKFDFHLDKEYDYFGKCEMTVEAIFTNIQRVKGIDKGDLRIVIKGKQVLDYKNRWGINKFNRFLFEIYLKIKKKEFLNTYSIKVVTEVNALYDYLKDNLEAYHA